MHIRRRKGSWKTVLVFATSLCLLGLGIYNIILKASFRLLDDGVYWEERDGRTLAKRVAAGGPAAGAGVRTGDLLVMIDDVPVNSPEDVQQILDRSEEGVSLSYQILRENERRAFAVRIAPLPRGPVGPYYFLAGVGIFSLAVGTFVYVRRRGIRAAAHFYVLCLFWFLAFGFSPTGKLDFWDSAIYWIDRIGVLFFPPIFLHFALCFPKRKLVVKKNRWVLPSLYLPSVLFIGVALAGKLFFFAQVPWGDSFLVAVETILDRLGPTYVSIMSLAAFAAFVDSYRRALTVTVKKQTKWIVWGTGFGTATFAVFYAIPYLFSVQSRLAAELSVIALALIPLSFAYAIVKYRLMDVEVLFKRGVVYTLATATAVSVYLAIFFSGSRYLVEESNRTVIAVLATLVAVFLFTPLKSRIQVGIDRLFYREKFDYRRALLAFSRDLNAHLDLDLLSLRLVERIRDTFEVERVALLGRDGEGSDLSLLAGCGLLETESRTARMGTDSELFSRLTGGEMVCRGELDSGGSLSRADFEQERGVSMMEGFQYAIPCIVEGKVVGVVLLGRHRTQSALSSEDTELLLTLSGQAATALENARLYRSLELKAEQFERLKEASENTIESLDSGILVLDLSGRIVRWNRALERLYGVIRDDALGLSLAELFPVAFQEDLEASMGTEWWTRAEAAGISRLRLTNRRGEMKVVTLRVGPFVSEGGETQGSIVIFEDITARVEIERELQLREKMVSLGLLAAGVAHEVNTPLTGISSFTQMLLEQTPGDDGRTKLLEKIEQQTERASKIVNSLLNFARQGRSEFTPVDVNEVMTDVLSLLEHQLSRARIQVRRELEPNLPKILGDENKLQQVFLNLILNAQEAMPSGGWLTVSTSHSGTEVVAGVSDTGHGISKEDIKRIYDLFFTTKRGRGSGTGLGLSITYGIVHEHSGHISVESAVGKGTCFRIRLPFCATAAGLESSATQRRESKQESGARAAGGSLQSTR